MLDKKFFDAIFKQNASDTIARRKIISESSNALHWSKQSIFALQRGKVTEAKEILDDAKKALISLNERFGKDGKLRTEGSWKAANEEYMEAKFFTDFMNGKKITGIKEFPVLSEEYLGALSDLTGEIVRMMILWTTKGDIKKVKEAGEIIHEVLHELMQSDYRGYLRTKFDQAKRNLQKSESVLYDLSIRDQ
jgi:predicted translin family RNA/ssDNA-binding protein